MSLNLPSPKTTNSAKRRGRGYGSGVGSHTAGRGQKGQKSRSGYKSPRPGFEGGQMPLSRRLPKFRGEVSGRSRKFFQSRENDYTIRLSQLKNFAGRTLTNNEIINLGLVKVTGKNPMVKVLFDGKINFNINLVKVLISAKAKDAVEAAGGTVVV